MTDHIRFVGAGKMVSAIVHSLLRSGAFSADQISCCSAKDGTSEKLSQATGISRFDSVEEMLANPTTILVLGCKPQQLGEMPTSVSDSTSGCLILSIMAGIPMARLKHVFPTPGMWFVRCQIPPGRLDMESPATYLTNHPLRKIVR